MTDRQTDASDFIICTMLCRSNGTDKILYDTDDRVNDAAATDAAWLQELVSVYLNQHPDSIAAVNLRACNLFRLQGDHPATVCIGRAVTCKIKSCTHCFTRWRPPIAKTFVACRLPRAACVWSSSSGHLCINITFAAAQRAKVL